MTQTATSREAPDTVWHDCGFLTCSVLPVATACNLKCPFCFSRSSISSLRRDRIHWSRRSVERYYAFARERGASRLVITGGGEPLLRSDTVVDLVKWGRAHFSEVACFTNGTFLTTPLARRLADAGLSYLCYSRHHDDDRRCRELMGEGTPTLAKFFSSAGSLKIRAVCVMAKGQIETAQDVWRYLHKLSAYGVREFTLKHTYVAYPGSYFGNSQENAWARRHQVDADPFAGTGRVVGRLPWGPAVRTIGPWQVCYYHEPTPLWEKEQRLCRSSNLMSDGSIYASLEDTSSRLCHLDNC